MARTNIPITALSVNGSIAQPSATNADGTNHHVIAAESDSDRLFLEAIAGSNSGDGGTVTVKAGVNPPAFQSGLGDLAVVLADSATKLIGPLESSRFVQADGSINVDVTSFVGTFRAYRLPKT